MMSTIYKITKPIDEWGRTKQNKTNWSEVIKKKNIIFFLFVPCLTSDAGVRSMIWYPSCGVVWCICHNKKKTVENRRKKREKKKKRLLHLC